MQMKGNCSLSGVSGTVVNLLSPYCSQHSIIFITKKLVSHIEHAASPSEIHLCLTNILNVQDRFYLSWLSSLQVSFLFLWGVRGL